MGHAMNWAKALWLAVLATSAVPAAAQIATPHVAIHLAPLSQAPASGEDTPLAIAIDPGAGWHIYWQNPGDSGYAPRFDWQLPKGVTITAPQHPAPTRMELGGIVMNVHTGPTVLLAGLRVPAGMAPGTPLAITGTADLLVCSEASCVPQSVALSLPLTVGYGRADPAASHLIAEASRRLPMPVAEAVPFYVRDGAAHIDLSGIAGAGGALSLFPAATDGGALGMVHRDGDALVVPLGTLTPGKGFDAVLVAGTGRAWALHLVARAPVATGGFGWLLALGGALLGGLVLNLMPCVFPILSLKAMALIRSGTGPAEARAEALGYLAGACGAVMALGGMVLALRAGGAAVGWAFQLQSPAVVAVLLLLVFAIALNLAGLFELPTLGGGLAHGQRSGFLGGMGSGALAAFVATPCTGPFMAGALGAALVLPAYQAMAIFAGLGLGLALPFVVIGLWEPARRLMPRPGAWMNRLRHILAIPMFATALGLAWLVGNEAGISAMTVALIAALGLGLGLWWMGMRQRRMVAVWHCWPVLAASLAVALVGVGAVRPQAAVAASGDVMPYSAARLDDLRQHHRPVLVYATAAWCLTCKVNEASSLSVTRVHAAFVAHGAVMMEADWTRSDPQVTKLLVAHGRAGVPLYVWYPARGGERELPQVLTPDLVAGLVTG